MNIKKITKKLVCSIALFGTILSATNIPVKAESAYNKGTMGYVAGYSLNGDATISSGALRQMEYYEVGGTPAFCLEAQVVMPDGTTEVTPSPLEGSSLWKPNGNLVVDETLQSKLAAIAEYGFRRNMADVWATAKDTVDGANYNKAYAFTQRLIWETTGYTIKFETPGHEYLENEYINYKNIVMGYVNNFNVKPSFNFATLDLKVGESKTLTDTNGVFATYRGSETIPSNITISTNGNDITITGVSEGTAQYIKDRYANGVIERVPLVYSNGTSQKVSKLYVKDPGVVTLDVNVTPNTYDYKLIKTDENGNVLPGVVFSFYDNAGDFWKDVTTDQNGQIILKGLPIYPTGSGVKLTYKEKTALPGYKLDPTVYTIDLTKPEVTSNTVKNEREDFKLQLIKENKQGAKLNGAIYKVENKTQNTSKDITVTNGDLLVDGFHLNDKVVVTEIKAPAGYLLDATPRTITIQSTNNIVKIQNDVPVAKFTLRKIDETTGAKLQGAKFNLYKKGNSTPISNFTTNEQGLAVVSDLPVGQYQVKEVVAPTGYVLDPTIYDVDLSFVNQTTSVIVKELTIKNKENFTIITKEDFSTGEKLPGATVTIYTDKDKFVQESVTDKDGKVVFKKLADGKYYFKEKNAPKGYTVNPDKHPFEIKNGKVIKMDVLKDTTTNVKLFKVDVDTKLKLAGVTFDLLDSNKKVIKKDLVTDKNGLIQVDKLPVGDYYFKETKTLEDYQLNTSLIPFKITDSKSNQPVVTVTNARYSQVVITKKDISTKAPIPGATIEIHNEKGEVIHKETSNAKGEIVFDKLTKGKYYFKETNAPKGYTINPGLHWFEVTENGMVIKSDLSDEMTEVKLHKIDVDTKENLKDVQFSVLDNNKKVIKENLVTDENGIIDLKGLPVGDYYFKETKTLENYQLNTELIPFKVTDEYKKVVNVEVTNAKYSVIIINKTDISDKKPLPDTTISIHNEKDEELFKGKTDKEGKLTFSKLTKGKYYFLEREAPIGYVINTDKHFFEVKENGEVVKCTLEDERNVEINKTDVDTSKPLPNAEFTLWNDKNEVVAKGKTDENGQIKLALPVGKYRYEETGVPDGYDKSIVKSGIIEVKENGIKYVEKVTNKKLQLESLPETGEAKTPYVVVFGGIFLALAFIMIVNTIDKKKKNTKK